MMAQNNLKNKFINNIKRQTSFAVFSMAAADILSSDTALLATLPEDTIVTKVIALPGVGVNAGATIDIKLGGNLIVDELIVDAVTDGTVVLQHNTVPADLTVEAGAVAPTTGDWEIYVEFAELQKKTGEYIS